MRGGGESRCTSPCRPCLRLPSLLIAVHGCMSMKMAFYARGTDMSTDHEAERLRAAQTGKAAWRRWGPYLSERQWGTVREDYSEHGDAWNYFTHDQARSRAYRWGEDGLAGISDDHQRLVLRAGAVERQRPDPQGAPLRPDQQRGQSRRGREGVLLLSRLDADALVHEVSVQVPAAAFPYDDLVDDQPRAAARPSSSTSCSIPACSTTTATSTYSSSTRRRRPRTS